MVFDEKDCDRAEHALMRANDSVATPHIKPTIVSRSTRPVNSASPMARPGSIFDFLREFQRLNRPLKLRDVPTFWPARSDSARSFSLQTHTKRKSPGMGCPGRVQINFDGFTRD